MTFAATFSRRQLYGSEHEVVYTFTGVTGDTGSTISTGFKTVREVFGSGEKADGSANLAALVCGKTATAGQVRVTYTNPAANHTGRVTVRGTY